MNAVSLCQLDAAVSKSLRSLRFISLLLLVEQCRYARI